MKARMPATPTNTNLVLPHGAWPSPVGPIDLATKAPAVREPGTNGTDIFWTESRPQERGRYVLVRQTMDGPVDVTPEPWNVRNRVHEYGGGSWAADGEIIVFSNFSDNRLYRMSDSDPVPVPITPEGVFRYADLQLDRERSRLLAIREDHTAPDREPENTLVVLDLAGPNPSGGTVLVSGPDFVSSPRLNRDRSRICWLNWNHPRMPWDGTTLSHATLSGEGVLDDIQIVAGGDSESVILPGWDHQDRLLFVSDRTGWWHLYRQEEHAAQQLTDGAREFGIPLWQFGASTWALLADGSIVTGWTQKGSWNVSVLDPETGAMSDLDLPFTSLSAIQAHPDGNRVLATAGTAHAESQLLVIDPRTGDVAPLNPPSASVLDPDDISAAVPISWATPDGAYAHGFYYAPRNRAATAPPGDLPPLIVESHGGPTGATDTTLDLQLQYWTSRGFAVVDVNYGGSTGYGRPYRERLNGMWGVVDVDDCVSGARYLADQGLVDGRRLIIRGGSAGGFTTLAALAFRDDFLAGVSYYGIGDLEAMAQDTHKFESRYLDTLVGPYPEAIQTYRERSAIHHVDKVGCAMILFQGMDDKVVPPNQAEMMADAVRKKGLPVTLLMFEDEGHGFRMADTIVRTLEAELSFFAQICGFTLDSDLPKLKIDNLPAS